MKLFVFPHEASSKEERIEQTWIEFLHFVHLGSAGSSPQAASATQPIKLKQ